MESSGEDRHLPAVDGATGSSDVAVPGEDDAVSADDVAVPADDGGVPDADAASVEADVVPAESETLADVPTLAAVDAPAGDDVASTGADPLAEAEALAAAGNEVRLAVLRRLHRAERAGEAPPTFTDLFEATDADTTAGFAYHLRQLDDRFVRAVEGSADGEETTGDGREGAGYRLTAAGRRLARALAAGAFTDRPSFDPAAVGDPCPHCGAGALAAACEDGVVAVACAACGRPVLTAPAPPGADAHAPADLLAAVDRRQRHRLSLAADGVCPDCGGPVTASLDEDPTTTAGAPAVATATGAATAGTATAGTAMADLPDGDRAVQARLSCGGCGARWRAPVTHAVLDHPAVVAFYREHGTDLRERPVWNVGAEWRETVLSTDPWCVRVSTALDGDVLSLFVGDDLSVRAVRRPSAS